MSSARWGYIALFFFNGQKSAFGGSSQDNFENLHFLKIMLCRECHKFIRAVNVHKNKVFFSISDDNNPQDGFTMPILSSNMTDILGFTLTRTCIHLGHS